MIDVKWWFHLSLVWGVVTSFQSLWAQVTTFRISILLEPQPWEERLGQYGLASCLDPFGQTIGLMTYWVIALIRNNAYQYIFFIFMINFKLYKKLKVNNYFFFQLLLTFLDFFKLFFNFSQFSNFMGIFGIAKYDQVRN